VCERERYRAIISSFLCFRFIPNASFFLSSVIHYPHIPWSFSTSTVIAHPILHDRTLATSSILLSLTYFQLSRRSTTSIPASTSCCISCHLLVVASYLADNIVESVIDVDSRFCRCFDEFAAKRSSQCLSLYPFKNILAKLRSDHFWFPQNSDKP
jgi:hypothetical protein